MNPEIAFQSGQGNAKLHPCMRVKRLEIQGFKSFKDKTVIHFDHSITGIVGPNGCGKSNIVDAFFWVMGEQSYKHMRGTSGEDLIFNGSSKYSALGLAEATLVLESQTEIDDASLDAAPSGATARDLPPRLQSKEVSVTRRLYRSGEGEYFINGVLSRLKDIQELFMDTGVGAKGYSVIEQGQIGKIVNAKPEDRRLLIEDAAGIAKYKARKRESLRKMDATQANLSRLTDIIQEIEKSLSSLERQAQKAKQYKKYKDELSEKEITWGRRKFQILTQKLEEAKARRTELEQNLVGLKAELQTSENTIEVERVRLLEETKAAEDLQNQIQSLADQLSQEKSALELSKRRQGDLTQQLSALDTEKLELDEAIALGNTQLIEAEQQAALADTTVVEEASQVQVLSEEVQKRRQDLSQSKTQMEQSQRQLNQLNADISQYTSKIASIQARIEATETHKARTIEEISHHQGRADSLAAELAQTKERVQELSERRTLTAQKKNDSQAQKERLQKSLKELEAQKLSTEKSWAQLTSKLGGLEELDASREGLAEGPKSILDWAKQNDCQQKIQALTDVVQITPGYEIVFQSWLEDKIEHLVSSDLKLTFDRLAQTAKDKKGRVAVQLPSLSPKSSQEHPKVDSFEKIQKVLSEAGFEVLGELSQFVQVANQPHSELSQLTPLNAMIKNVCVVRSADPLQAGLEGTGPGTSADAKNSNSLNSLNSLMSSLGGWSIASLDGTVLECSGVMRGGSLDASGSLVLLRRKQQIEALKEQSAQADLLRQQAASAYAQGELELTEAQKQLDAHQASLQVLEIEFASLDRDIHQTERAQSEANAQLEGLRRVIERIENDAEDTQLEHQSLQSSLIELNASKSELEQTSAQSQALHQSAETELREKEQSLGEMRISEASVQERLRGLKREVENLRSRLSDRSRRLQEIHKTLERANLERTEFSGNEAELAQNVEKLVLSLAENRSQLAEIKDRVEQRNAQVSSSLDQTKTFHKQSEKLTTECNDLALETEKLAGEISHIQLNLEEKYGPGCLQKPATQQLEIGDAIGTAEISWGEISQEEERILGEEVEKLRERIRRLGEVNVMAIEEFEALKTRHDFLIAERTDLNTSLKNLQEAIEHINKTSEERFEKAFTTIAERFERLFPIIFGGGSAKLSLVYPEGSTDILDAGVDILAQPPGKKVANITLLSGGEKALTAVSLIFAIFMVKPSPFCVLDEVDAPLDDANIGKFNALLKEMSAKSQFILITHNKKTMELNDTLYGVTMEEPGVSKMVSIQMN